MKKDLTEWLLERLDEEKDEKFQEFKRKILKTPIDKILTKAEISDFVRDVHNYHPLADVDDEDIKKELRKIRIKGVHKWETKRLPAGDYKKNLGEYVAMVVIKDGAFVSNLFYDIETGKKIDFPKDKDDVE